MQIELVPYDESFLELSWRWLKDYEIQEMTMTPQISRQEQVEFYKSLPSRQNYIIFGIMFGDEKIGACGLKNINGDTAEYWGYIGEKKYWGKGLGAKIVDLIISEAKRRNISKLYLKVSVNNSRAIKLYKKLRFSFIADYNSYHLMDKQI